MRGTIVSCTSRDRRGFALAPILYLLGLIGVMGGVLFSGYSQILKSGQTVQNSMTVRSDLQAAANTLSAQAVFGTNGLTFCPPRSVHQSSGNPCAAAPVTLVQFADFTGTQLPANYANAGTTGSPVEVGVFAAGSGEKILDPYGHAYIYCRWENSSSNPASPAFILLSAGANGNLQTRCGDTAAQGDDGYLMVTVGAAINHAALWQTVGTSTVGFGATGTQVTVDNSGDINAAGNITAQNAAITNAITANTLTTTGNIAGADISANALTTSGSITSSATVIGTSGEFANLSGGNLNISGEATIIGTSFLGNLSAGVSTLNSLNVTNNAAIGGGITIQGGATVVGTSTLGNLSAGASTLNSLTVTNSASLNSGLFIQGGDLDLANGNSYAQIDSTGVSRRLIALSPTNDIFLGGRSGTNDIDFLAGGAEVGWFDTSGNFTVTGNITGANGSFGNLGAAATTLTGNLTGTNATFSGTVTASSFVGNLNLGASGSSISGIVPLANGGTGYAASSVSNLLNDLFGNDIAPSVTIPAARLPALSGDVTHAAGSSTTSIAAIQGTTITGVTGSGNVVLSASPTITGILSAPTAAFSGFVGIGTTTPTAVLSVLQPTGSSPTIFSATANVVNGSGAFSVLNSGVAMFSGNNVVIGYDSNVSRTAVSTPTNDLYLTTDLSSVGNNNIILLPHGTGNVGIGTASPGATLDVGGNNGTAYVHIAGNNTSPAVTEQGLYIDWNLLTGTYGETDFINNKGISVGGFSFVNSTALHSPLMLISATGYVGIGTATPIYPLQVVDYVSATPPSGGFASNITGNPADSSMILQRWSGTGSLYYGVTMDNNNGALSFETTNAAAIGTQTFNIRMFITNAGNVGIGTTNPQATLDVNGYEKLVAQTSPPATCASANKGAIAMTTNNGLCFCNGSAWNKVESPTTACAW